MENVPQSLIDFLNASSLEEADCSEVLCQRKLPFEVIQKAASKAFLNDEVKIIFELLKSDFFISNDRMNFPQVLVGEYFAGDFLEFRYEFFFKDSWRKEDYGVFLYEISRQSKTDLTVDNFVERNQVSFINISARCFQEVFLDFDQEDGDILGIEKLAKVYWSEI